MQHHKHHKQQRVPVITGHELDTLHTFTNALLLHRSRPKSLTSSIGCRKAITVKWSNLTPTTSHTHKCSAAALVTAKRLSSNTGVKKVTRTFIAKTIGLTHLQVLRYCTCHGQKAFPVSSGPTTRAVCSLEGALWRADAEQHTPAS